MCKKERVENVCTRGGGGNMCKREWKMCVRERVEKCVTEKVENICVREREREREQGGAMQERVEEISEGEQVSEG